MDFLGLNQVEGAKATGKWRLEGYDTFEGGPDGYYFIEGEYDTEQEAIEAARKYLGELEKTQPSSVSGGQEAHGIQDHVYVVDPNGRGRRFTG